MRVFIGNGKVTNVIKKPDDQILSHADIEITNYKKVDDVLSKLSKGSVVINTAARINLEWCQDNKEDSYTTNVLGAVNVANSCMKHGHHLVHVSSGCIFDGMETNRIYTENDDPTPASWYAECKAEADQKILSSGYDKITIIRPRQLISAIQNPTNMLTKFASISEGDFIDVKNSVTCIEDMGEMLNHLIKQEKYGIYNLANLGYSTPYQIALRVKNSLNPDMVVRQISYDNYVQKIRVKRVNTLLSVDKLIETGYMPRSIDDSLTWCLNNYGKIS